jgi:protein phosphatase PTC7
MKWSSTIASLAILASNCISCSHAFCPASSSSSPSSSSSSKTSRLFLNPLGQEGDWAAYLDDVNTGLVYYFNANTGESLWEPPSKTFPKVALDPNQRLIASAKQQEYKKSVVGGNDIITVTTKKETTTTDNNDSSTTISAQEEEKKGGGFPFFGRGKKVDEVLVVQQQQQQQPVSVPVPVPVEENKGRFGLGAIFGGGNNKNDDDDDDDDDNVINGAAAAIAEAAATLNKSPPPKQQTPKIIAPETVDTTIKIDMSAYVLPHPAKVRWGGEDAVFIRGRSFGVFDGVSGAEKLDGVPLYSVTLAQELKTMVDPKEFLSVAAITQVLTSAAEFADKAATGASTAVVASLSEDGELNVLNVGDCTCAVVRDNKVVAKTREIIHYFDCPYQLSEDSPDRPRDGTKLTMKVKKGDVIVMGSDGIFDNLQDVEIVQLVSNQKTRASMLARKVVERSRRVSLDEMADTPYAKLAKRNGDPDYQSGLGGKVDDVSCIVVKCT